ncbi:MAG: hypothetical protein JWO71_2377 [Candidatus Acidoferrum typicum]|nr:hypothetical protein [Candidatus Acidoferrum typicum]
MQTRQWHASDGTPIEVPEPSTVTFMGAADISLDEIVSKRTRSWEFTRARKMPLNEAKGKLRTRLGFGLLRGLGGHSLIDFKKGHLQLAEKIEEQRVFLRS